MPSAHPDIPTPVAPSVALVVLTDVAPGGDPDALPGAGPAWVAAWAACLSSDPALAAAADAEFRAYAATIPRAGPALAALVAGLGDGGAAPPGGPVSGSSRP